MYKINGMLVTILLAAVVAAGCEVKERTEVSSTETTATTTYESSATDTITTGTTPAVTETTATGGAQTAATPTPASVQITRGAREIGKGIEQGARTVAKEAGAVLEEAGRELKEQAATPAPAPAMPTGSSARGATLFAAQCVACHGQAGENDTAMARKQNLPPFSAPAVQNMSDSALADAIRNGRGPTSARAHKAKALTDQQVRDLAAYIQSLG